MATRLDEVFHGINPIKLNTLESYQSSRYDSLGAERVTAEVNAAKGQAAVPALIDIMTGVGFLGVLIFAGLTAYDTQQIKSEYIAHAHHGDAEWLEKSGIHGALNLYLDFLNMFQFLLMFMGSSE